jgi:hypothetical protein
MLASFGAFGLLASFVEVAASHPQRLVRVTRRFFVALHVVLAPLVFMPMLNQTLPIERAAQAIVAAIPEHAPNQVIIVSSPLDILSVHAAALLNEEPARARPDSLHQLYTCASRIQARRLDAQTCELVADDGWGNVALERVFSTVANMPRAGSELALESMRVLAAESTPDGRPKRVQFRFPTPLEAADRLWLTWQRQKPVPWKPPPIGQTATLPTLDLFSSLEP